MTNYALDDNTDPNDGINAPSDALVQASPCGGGNVNPCRRIQVNTDSVRIY